MEEENDENLKVPNLPPTRSNSLFSSKSRRLLGAKPRLRAVTVDGVALMQERNKLPQQGGFRVDGVAQKTPSEPRELRHP